MRGSMIENQPLILNKTNMEEIWKDIDGYEGIYQVSNMGQVKSLDRMVTNIDGVTYMVRGRILRQANDDKGYKRVTLSKNCITKNYQVHRLVAIAFIPNPNNYPVVNHLDETPQNNRVDNLEFCTQEHNLKYGTCRERTNLTLRQKRPFGKHVEQWSLDGVFIKEYPSLAEASRAMTGKKDSGIYSIRQCCSHAPYYYSAFGYQWRLTDSNDVISPMQGTKECGRCDSCSNCELHIKCPVVLAIRRDHSHYCKNNRWKNYNK